MTRTIAPPRKSIIKPKRPKRYYVALSEFDVIFHDIRVLKILYLAFTLIPSSNLKRIVSYYKIGLAR